jgi:hypothetical protein
VRGQRQTLGQGCNRLQDHVGITMQCNAQCVRTGEVRRALRKVGDGARGYDASHGLGSCARQRIGRGSARCLGEPRSPVILAFSGRVRLSFFCRSWGQGWTRVMQCEGAQYLYAGVEKTLLCERCWDRRGAGAISWLTGGIWRRALPPVPSPSPSAARGAQCCTLFWV